jgi:hypothetical protein
MTHKLLETSIKFYKSSILRQRINYIAMTDKLGWNERKILLLKHPQLEHKIISSGQIMFVNSDDN